MILEKEISHIRNYIELERVRLSNKLKIYFLISGLTENKQVPPLLFLPLIENCFKHVLTKERDNVISITLTANQHSLVLQTKNQSGQQLFNKNSGIGMRNVQRRLELLYGTNYTLETHFINGLFTATLEIPIS